MAQLTTPTFIIGLGGIGNIVTRLVWERYAASGQALPSTLRIRSIDTAAQSEHELARPLPDEMFTRLGQFQSNDVIHNLDLFPQVKRWWKYPPNAFAHGFIDNGAGARRPVGRLAFFQEFAKVHDAIRADLAVPLKDEVQRALFDARLGGVSRAPRVFIVGSVAGGTGSGTFLDVAFLTRHLFGHLGYHPSAGTITGILGLPSVIHLASGDPDSTQARERQVNAMGALAELDYLTRGWASGEVELDYPQPVGRFEPQPPLFNQTYIFTDRRLRGVTFSRQADVLQRVAHFVYSQIALGMGEETLKILDNYKSFFDPSQQRVADGLSATYSAFGVEWLEVPHELLINEWSREIGEAVAGGVAEFQWGQETRRNLESVVRNRLVDRYEAYRLALEVGEASAETVFAVRGIPDIQPFLTAIQGATNREALQEALQAFDTQVPGLLEPLRRQLRNLPTAEEDQEWTRAIGADLLKDREFRAGGGRRVLDKAAELLRGVSGPVRETESIADILKLSGGSWFSRLDTAPAVDWAKRRLVQQSQLLAKSEAGNRAARLADECASVANELDVLQQTVRSEGALLGQQVRRGWVPPRDAWMLGEEEIRSAIAENRSAVTSMVIAAASEALSEALLDGQSSSPAARRAAFSNCFIEATLDALERESVRLTRRPVDMLHRIQTRLESCEPLAHIITDGPEAIRIMAGTTPPTPLKLVLTAIEDEQRAELERWAHEQQRAAGDRNSYQIPHSPDPLRDDALYLSFGWPLWLFREVRACQDATDLLSRENNMTVIASRIMGEIPKAGSHEVRPMPPAKTELLFAYAFIGGDVRAVRADRIVFSQQLFPGQPDESSLTSALSRFKRDGLNRIYADVLLKWQVEGGLFKQKMMESLARIDAGLSARGFPESMADEVRRFASLVRTDLEQIVAL